MSISAILLVINDVLVDIEAHIYGDLVNLENPSAQSLKGDHKVRVTCLYSYK